MSYPPHWKKRCTPQHTNQGCSFVLESESEDQKSTSASRAAITLSIQIEGKQGTVGHNRQAFEKFRQIAGLRCRALICNLLDWPARRQRCDTARAPTGRD